MRDDPDVQRAVAAWQLALPHAALRGRNGEIAGRSAGSSLEFHEYRQYLPGDDVRNLDWSAYARTDQLMIRLHREELSPRTDILLDASGSMAAGNGEKWRVSRQLAVALAMLAERLGGPARVYAADDLQPPSSLSGSGLQQLQNWSCVGRRSLKDVVAARAVPWQAHGLRIVLSDFLFPHEPGPLVQRLADGAGLLWLIQTVTAWELEPTSPGGRRLVDPETDEHLDLVITPGTLARYRSRLQQLRDGLERAAHLAGAVFVTAVVDRGLETLCRDDLFPRGVLQPVA